MWISKSIFSLLLFAVAVRTSIGAGTCDSPRSLTPFIKVIEKAYLANSEFIRRGVPAGLVQDLVSDAIWNIAYDCSCTHQNVNNGCVKEYLNGKGIVKQILIEIANDVSREKELKYFPLYSTFKLGKPSYWQREYVVYELQYLLKNSRTTNDVLVPYWEGVFYPDEGILFDDTLEEQQKSCGVLDAVGEYHKITISGEVATAYVVGLVQEVRYAGGDVTRARELLANHVHFLFQALRCTAAAWQYIEIPIMVVIIIARQAKHLLQEALSAAKNPPLVDRISRTIKTIGDIKTISEPSMYHFPEMIQRLSSWESYGRGDYFLRMVEGRLIRANVEEVLASVTYSRYVGLPQGGGRICNDGYFSSPGLGRRSGDEVCCAKPCISMSQHYTSIFSLRIDQETCCNLCNQAYCPGDGRSKVTELFVTHLKERTAWCISI